MRSFTGGQGLKDDEPVLLILSDESRIYAWDTGSSAADDGVDVIKITSWVGNGRFVLRKTNAENIEFDPAGTGAVTRSAESKLREFLSITDYGADPTGVTDSTAEILLARNAAIAENYSGLRFPAGTYIGSLSIRSSNFSVIGDGSGCTTLKLPDGVDTNVLELGDTANGNSSAAYDKITVRGITVDGNRDNTTVPSDDLTGWGIPLTKITNYSLTDLVIKDCHQGGIGAFINSNYGRIEASIENCGNATQGTPNLDFNSSKYVTFDVVTKDGLYGSRILDNCFGVSGRIVSYNPSVTGFVMSNQLLNEGVFGCHVDVSVIGGCSTNGFQLGARCYSNKIRLSTKGITGGGFYSIAQSASVVSHNATTYTCILDHVASAATEPGVGASWATYWSATGSGGISWVSGATYLVNNDSRSNEISVCTFKSGTYSALIDGDDNSYAINSHLDGRTGSQGTSNAVEVNGDRNRISANIVDSPTWQVRGIKFEAGSTENDLIAFSWTNTADPISNAGTRNMINHGEGKGDDIVSAAEIQIPFRGNVFTVTGTTTISDIGTSFAAKERVITLIFEDSVQVTDASGNLRLNGNFNTTADDTLTLWCDGTNWYEISRSAN